MSYLVITTSYKVKRDKRERYLELMRRVRENSLDLGAVDQYLLEDDARSNDFTEILVYDSWIQYENARRFPTTRAMEDVFKELEGCIEGGFDRCEVDHFKSHMGNWETAPSKSES